MSSGIVLRGEHLDGPNCLDPRRENDKIPKPWAKSDRKAEALRREVLSNPEAFRQHA